MPVLAAACMRAYLALPATFAWKLLLSCDMMMIMVMMMTTMVVMTTVWRENDRAASKGKVGVAHLFKL
jgi:hypothetical protein